ncbi:unnamed protein product [Arabis nemorensis]|uniref:Uncharacterized protein n=1 Tax=Arabis nemorensis TaxID=586526 RepID=A0A565CMF2_9BRAS|nr:unnamed protein product [Arabis nemorensis]
MSDINLHDDILVDIVRRVGRENFLFLGPIMESGRRGLTAVRNEVVLYETNLLHFIANGDQVREGAPYRGLFVRCLESGNEIAYLLESLRVAYNEGNVFKAINLVRRAYMRSLLTVFILGMLLICAGSFTIGDQILRALHWWEDVHQFNLLGAMVYGMIEKLDPPRRSTFTAIFRCDQTACGCEGEWFGSCMRCCVQYNAMELMSLS